MRRWIISAVLLAGGSLPVMPGRLSGDGPAQPIEAPVMRLPLTEQRVALVPTHPSVAVLLSFPEPISDFAGRGFSEDPADVSGDFFLRWIAGDPYLVVTPLSPGVRATLHVIVSGRAYAVHFFPATGEQAWAKVIFDRISGEGSSHPGTERGDTARPLVERTVRPPQAEPFKPATVPRLIGVLDTLKMLRSMTPQQGDALVAANRALRLARVETETDHGKYRIRLHLVLRNQTMDALGFAATLINTSGKELTFDPSSLLVRAGDHVFSSATSDLNPIIPAKAVVPFTFAVVNDGAGRPNFLAPDNKFRISLAEANPASPSARSLP